MGNASQRVEAGPAESRPRRRPSQAENDNAEDIRDKYELGKVLGSGSFGQVREAKLKAVPDRVRAVKIVERDDDANSSDFSNSDMFRQEVSLLQSLKHTNIVRFWDVYEDIHFLYVVMDLCKGGEVFSKILELKRFTEANAGTLGAQMLSAIEYIHDHNIMHRDLKAENFLLSDNSPTSVVKMIDFGMAAKFEHGKFFKEICGSPHYLAPELVGQKYDHMVDMWAFGVLMYLLMYGHYPYDGKSTKEIMVKVISESEPIRWQTRTKLTPLALQFLKRCLEPNPRKRFSAKDALKHKFIAAAAEPDDEIDPEKSEPVENLVEAVRDAHKKVTTTRAKVDERTKGRRQTKLVKIDQEFAKGIRQGNRLGETPKEDFMTKPEFVRRDNKLTTAPSAAVEAIRSRVAQGTVAISNKISDGVSRDVKKITSDDCHDENQDNAETTMASRRNKRGKTDRLMYMGDLAAEDEAELKNLWSTWKEQKNVDRIECDELPDMKNKESLDEAITQTRAEQADTAKAAADSSSAKPSPKAPAAKVRTRRPSDASNHTSRPSSRGAPSTAARRPSNASRGGKQSGQDGADFKGVMPGVPQNTKFGKQAGG
eukprot:TRINITY_DN94988_c0_g1_i1.p1 TRINITY_DN94988_c0_g1~~TRINITY_DN94988_c0_g1_i1.p1  ORF type:complete len:634 (+),score=139.75 TRINITY_DN94988_c0_g1_i1:112-1902(+)